MRNTALRRAAGLGAGAALLLAAACGGTSAPARPSGITTALPGTVAGPPAGAAAAATPTVDPIYAAWARDVCTATAGFDAAVVAVQDDVDPTTLELPDRVARAARRYQAYLDALRRTQAALSTVLAPADAASYERALAGQVTELEHLFAEQLQALPTATSGTEIDTMTADLQRSADNLAQGVRAAAGALPDGARAALNAATPCGRILG